MYERTPIWVIFAITAMYAIVTALIYQGVKVWVRSGDFPKVIICTISGQWRKPTEPPLKSVSGRLGGLFVPMLIEVHNELHNNVPHPKKPSQWQMQGVLQVVKDSITPFHDTIEVFERFANHPEPHYNHNARRIAENLTLQGEFIYGEFRFPREV